MYAVKFRRSIELDLQMYLADCQMYLADCHFLLICSVMKLKFLLLFH
jgi:hypothetical protein